MHKAFNFSKGKVEARRSIEASKEVKMEEIKSKTWDKLPEREEYLIQQAKIEEREKVLNEIQAGAVSVAGLIEKARQEVAKEIFEEIDKELDLWEDLSVKTHHQAAIVKTNWWQALKDRFLKEEK